MDAPVKEDDAPPGTPSLPNIRHLRVVESVARNASITRAASEVCLSQPAVTQAIAKIEAGVGKPLFDRTQHGSYLTPAGETYVHRVRRFLEQTDQSIRDLHSDEHARA